MTHCSFILLGIFALTGLYEANGQLFKMVQQDTNGILEKLQPQIGQVSQLMAASAGEGKETEQLITDHITKDLQLIWEKLTTLVNRTQGPLQSDASIQFCCRCGRCTRYAKICGQTCCTDGDKGCQCRSCSSSEVQNVPEVGSEMTPHVNSWLESAKNQLQTNLAGLMENINAGKTKCCTCVICKKKFTGCFNPFCCAKGGKLCKCISCSSGTVELITSMDSVSDSNTLIEGGPPAGDHINALIDSLIVLFNSP